MARSRSPWIVAALMAAGVLSPRLSVAQLRSSGPDLPDPEAESLVVSCHWLSQIDADAHALKCAGNQAVTAALRRVGRPDGPVARQIADAVRIDDAVVRRAWAEALGNEIDELSASFPSATNPASRSRASALSARILEAFRAYDADPARWLVLESDVMASHAALAALPAVQRKPVGLDPMPPYDEWRAAMLSDRDLAHALEYALAAAASRTAIGDAALEVPFAADLERQQYLQVAQASFRREVERRQSAGPPRMSKAQALLVAASLRSDPESRQQPSAAEKRFRVRLAEGRYRSPSAMPPLVARLTTGYIAEVHNADLARARDLYARLARQNDVAALSSAPLGAAHTSQLQQARADTLAALSRLDAVIRAQEQSGYVWNGAGTRDLDAMIAGLGGRGATSDAPLLRLFERASASIAAIEIALAKTDTTARPIGGDKGRLVISREQAKTDTGDIDAMERQPELPRLPDRLVAWKGFLNPQSRKPYDYERDVKAFRDFAPVGGGIHMGSTGLLDSKADLRHHVLTYSAASRELILVGPGGERATYGPVEPDVLKALYRFAASGQNAAISIGWAGQFDPATNGRRGAHTLQPILLDPTFVDTRVGQDLIAADALPWDLEHDPLPGGEDNPIADPFRQAHERFVQSRVALLDRVCRNVPPLTYASGMLMSDAFAPGERATYLDLLVFSVLTRKTLAGAKTLFLAETNYELLAHEELRRGPKANADELRKIRTAKAAIDGLVKWLGDSEDRLQVLAGAAAYAMEDGEADVKWIQLFTAALRAQKAVAASNIAAAVHDALPTTTLAVLLDEATRIRVEDGRVHLDGTMRYRYATSLIRVADGLLVMSQGAGANRTRVETITELTDLANSVMPALIERYEPLRRVSEYSRVLALLRWARQPGNILAVDFADLGPVRASDRQSTPTADALRGRR